MERLFSGSSPISLTTVGIVILVLLALDVLFTLGFAAVVSGRSRQDYDIPFLGAAANHLYNRSEQGRPLSLSLSLSGGSYSMAWRVIMTAPFDLILLK